MKKRDNVNERKSILVTMLISIIVILVLILGYGVYTGLRVRAEINSLYSQIGQLSEDKADLNLKLDSLQGKYDLLYQDVQKIYRGCIAENACKGRFPGVSWYCNNVGDETSNPSHICVCNSSCQLNATEILD